MWVNGCFVSFDTLVHFLRGSGVWGLGFSFLIFPGNSRRPNRAGSFSDFNLLLWFYGNVLYSTISLGWIMLPLVAEENRGAE